MTLSYPPEALVLAAVLIPFIGALLIPVFHRVPNLREAVTLATAGALFLDACSACSVPCLPAPVPKR